MKRIMTILVGILAVSAIFGAEADPEYIQSFEFDIKMQTLEGVRERVTQESILNKYKIRLPILPPRLDQQQVTALVEKEIDARVEAAYPKSQFKQIEVDAREHFREYLVNDVVTMRLLDPRTNQYRDITDSIRKIDKRGVILGDVHHIYTDLDPKELPHFFKKTRDDHIMRYISGQTKVYEYQRSQEDKKLRKKLLPKIWMDEGYIRNRKKQKWVPREEVFTFLYQRKLIEAFSKEKTEVSHIILPEKAGLKWDDALNMWIVPGEEAIVDETAAKIGEATKTTATKANDSLKGWVTKFEDIFAEGADKKDDVWDEEEEPEEKKAPKETTKDAAKDVKPTKAE